MGEIPLSPPFAKGEGFWRGEEHRTFNPPAGGNVGVWRGLRKRTACRGQMTKGEGIGGFEKGKFGTKFLRGSSERIDPVFCGTSDEDPDEVWDKEGKFGIPRSPRDSRRSFRTR